MNFYNQKLTHGERSLKKAFFLGVLFILILSFGNVFKFPERSLPLSVEKKILSISHEDRILLSYFFRSLIMTFCAGHVLYGTKPMCITGYRNPFQNYLKGDRTSSLSCWHSCDRHFIPYCLRMEAGLKTWKKYESLFPMHNFALIDYTAEDVTTIILINKKEILKKIEEEIHEFTRFYHKKMEPKEILDQILNRDPTFFALLRKHHDMLGILLGYGTRNAKLFERKVQLWIGLGKLKPNRLNCHFKPASEFASLEEELRDLDEKTKIEPVKASNLNFTPRVGFVYDKDDPETRRLKQNYHLEQRQITQIYEEGNFLQVSLSKLCET